MKTLVRLPSSSRIRVAQLTVVMLLGFVSLEARAGEVLLLDQHRYISAGCAAATSGYGSDSSSDSTGADNFDEFLTEVSVGAGRPYSSARADAEQHSNISASLMEASGRIYISLEAQWDPERSTYASCTSESYFEAQFSLPKKYEFQISGVTRATGSPQHKRDGAGTLLLEDGTYFELTHDESVLYRIRHLGSQEAPLSEEGVLEAGEYTLKIWTAAWFQVSDGGGGAGSSWYSITFELSELVPTNQVSIGVIKARY